MDTYIPDVSGAIKFNDYTVENYVDHDSSRFSIDLWNVDKPEMRLKSISTETEPTEPKSEEHVFQRHQAEESQIQIRKKKKRNNDVDLLLEQLLQQFYDGQFTQMDLAVKCDLAVKTSHLKL
ncbi:unnamed protein product [Rotaria magnacalcarata]|uniref:Uncharacterized protein n=1 Tax=Rotaria magnacalcarata TaxID=392030 RepID=A0A816BWI9_9BILA|nr:unnamed protein product [Rotaria magnacalcarata]CAF1614212.1 unnamed protein product [Rotaria magnacalcarata]CAF1914683.1 unnamed protein product [Rotaria magnacalcarata]CAF4134145.1 unnamed protein product [Rotaria magnacalcarata]